ncbi:hypothetical protein GJAV_G00236750 [Gymnothorax javanicus]|nr:hypothetical protein GJAV_G00236750 [Gymnothorax javanicus]
MSRGETGPQTRGGLRCGDLDRTGGQQECPEQPLVPEQNRETAGVMKKWCEPDVSDYGERAEEEVRAEMAPPASRTVPNPPSPDKDVPGSARSAHFGSVPGREQVRFCELGSVENGWLPVHKRALLFGVPVYACDPEDSPSQGLHVIELPEFSINKSLQSKEKMKGYIAVTTPRGYTKKSTGNGYIDGNSVGKSAQPLRAFQSPSQTIVKQAWSCWNLTDRDGQRSMYKEKRAYSTPPSASVESDSSHMDGGVASCRDSLLQRTVRTPGAPCPEDTESKNPLRKKMSFTSITITARKVPRTASATSQEESDTGGQNQARPAVSRAQSPIMQAKNRDSEAHPSPAARSTPPQPCTAPNGDHEPVVLRKKPLIMKVTEVQQGYCSRERATTARPPEFRHSYSEGDHKREPLSGPQGGLQVPGAELLRSCTDLNRLSRASSTILFRDKSLSVSLEERSPRRAVHRSTLSLYVSGTTPPANNDGSNQNPAQEHWNLRHPGKLSGRGAGDRTSDSHTCRSAERLLRGTPQASAVTPSQEGHPRRSDFNKRLPVCCQPQERLPHKGQGGAFLHGSDPVTADLKQPQRRHSPNRTAVHAPKSHAPNAGMAQGEDAGSQGRSQHIDGVVRRGPRRAVCEHGETRPSGWAGSFSVSQTSTPNSLTLREALELYRPDFITRSQGRVKRLEERSQRRRADQNSDRTVEPQGGRRRRKCTKPDPLSDNLFRPRDRSISRKDMQLRSKRIYDKLPEVARKQEQERKRVVSQTNRLRAEIFKKKLLDQVLQRDGDRERCSEP